MTLAPAPRQPDFPANPSDGFQIKEPLPDGGYVLWTYSEERNAWSYVVVAGHIEGTIYTNQVLTTPTLVTTDDGEKEWLETQEQVNNFIAETSSRAIRATGRAADQVDFLQNTVGKGTWVRTEGIPDSEDYPGPAEFWTDAVDFMDCTVFKFNDSGAPGFTNPGTLQDTRVGDYLTIQENSNNDFGQYIIKGMTTENVGKAGVIIRTFEVAVIRGLRAQGDVQPLSHCTVTTSRPMSVIVQDNQPTVSTRGILWYREADDHLFISNYGDGFTGEGPQWTDLTTGEGGGGDYLPLSGGTIDGMLTINKGPLMVNSAQVVELPTGGDLFTVLGSDNGNAIFVINGAGSGKYLGKQNVPENIATVGYCGDNYLPLIGGKVVTGNVTIDQASGTALNIKKNGVDKVKIEHGGRIFCGYDLSLDTDLRTVTTKGWVSSEIRTKGDERYLQLAAGGQITGYVQFKDDTKLQMGGTYNNNIIDGAEGFTDNSIVATLGFVNHAIANSSVGLSPREKMYLQGFYPWKVGAGSQINSPGDFLPKKSDYNVDLNPETWKYLYFSVVDAYGQDLAGTFMNHMDMDNQRELQLWVARENGAKICTFMGKMKCRDQNFEERFTIDFDSSDVDLVVSKHYDQASLRIDRGEVLWIKCSAWGN